MRTIALSFLLLACTGFARTAPVPKAIPAPDYYPTTVGTKWVYAREDGTREHSREISASKTDDGVTNFTVTWKDGDDTQLWELKKDATGVYRIKQDGAEFDPPQKLFEHKMAAGDEWPSEYKFGVSVRPYKYSRTVGKAEVVKTPAGEFTAVPIVSRNLNVDGDETTLWYANKVGLVKLHHKGDTPILLREFTAGK